jgi:N-acetylmuramoyl-L-alanine amidase
MSRIITVLVFVLLALTLVFSYKTKDYKFSFVKDLNKVVSGDGVGKVEQKLEIVERPIIFDAQRKYLTATYREKHTADCDYKANGVEACLKIDPKIIVVHMTDLKTFEDSFNHMNEPVLGEEREKLVSRSFDRLNVSSHYLIDRDGTIYRLMPETYMARHAIGVNHDSIGIEHVGMNAEGPSPEQVEASTKLVSYLMKKYGIGSDKIYSHQSTATLKEEGSPLFVEKDENYFEPKNCGQKILAELKGRLKQ